MSREFTVETQVEEIASTAIRQVQDLLGTEAVVLLADDSGALVPRAGENSSLAASEREKAVARWSYEHGRPAGHDSDTLPAAEGLYLPLIGSRGALGVFGVALGQRPSTPSPSQRQLLETFVAQTALALERVLLAEQAARAGIDIETERTRSALLSAVSHDLRTPLASITGTADVLLDPRTELDARARSELLETIRDEGERLSRLISNLLDLTRMQSGALSVHKEICPLEEPIATAVSRLRRVLHGRDVRVELPDEMLLVPVDPVLIEQVFVNLLENAARYSPAAAPIEVRAWVENGAAVVTIADRGPGLPPGDEERVFDKFYRTADGERAGGTGLGLTICRAIVLAHGGRIHAENRPDGGALFRFTLPLESASAVSEGRRAKLGSDIG